MKVQKKKRKEDAMHNQKLWAKRWMRRSGEPSTKRLYIATDRRLHEGIDRSSMASVYF